MGQYLMVLIMLMRYPWTGEGIAQVLQAKVYWETDCPYGAAWFDPNWPDGIHLCQGQDAWAIECLSVHEMQHYLAYWEKKGEERKSSYRQVSGGVNVYQASFAIPRTEQQTDVLSDTGWPTSRVLPTAYWDKFALVAMGEIGRSGWPDWKVNRARDIYMYHGYDGRMELHAELPWLYEGELPCSLFPWYPWFKGMDECLKLNTK